MQDAAPKLSMTQVLVCGALVVTLSMGIRHGFGLWLQPITQAQDWSRQTFAFAIAIQNLAWGCFGIFAGMVADRFGAFRVIIAGHSHKPQVTEREGILFVNPGSAGPRRFSLPVTVGYLTVTGGNASAEIRPLL